VYFQPQTRREPQIRLFRADWLEALTRVSPWLVIAVWVPVIVWFAVRAWSARHEHNTTAAELVAAAALGLGLWTLVEYLLHRFVFHFSPGSRPRLRRLVFLFHGIHHVQPWDKQRLVMPPGVSVPLAAFFYGLFAWLFARVLHAPGWLDATFAGFLAGYLAYDLLHYAAHHLTGRSHWFQILKRHHLLHHHVTPDQRYGVTSPLWDVLLRTMPRQTQDVSEERWS
jgi:hypothetical protein